MESKLRDLLVGAGIGHIVMSHKDFVKEHKKLLKILKSGKRSELDAEYKSQAAELASHGGSRNSGFIARMMGEVKSVHNGAYRPIKALSKKSTMNSPRVFDYGKMEKPSNWLQTKFGKTKASEVKKKVSGKGNFIFKGKTAKVAPAPAPAPAKPKPVAKPESRPTTPSDVRINKVMFDNEAETRRKIPTDERHQFFVRDGANRVQATKIMNGKRYKEWEREEGSIGRKLDALSQPIPVYEREFRRQYPKEDGEYRGVEPNAGKIPLSDEQKTSRNMLYESELAKMPYNKRDAPYPTRDNLLYQTLSKTMMETLSDDELFAKADIIHDELELLLRHYKTDVRAAKKDEDYKELFGQYRIIYDILASRGHTE